MSLATTQHPLAMASATASGCPSWYGLAPPARRRGRTAAVTTGGSGSRGSGCGRPPAPPDVRVPAGSGCPARRAADDREVGTCTVGFALLQQGHLLSDRDVDLLRARPPDDDEVAPAAQLEVGERLDQCRVGPGHAVRHHGDAHRERCRCRRSSFRPPRGGERRVPPAQGRPLAVPQYRPWNRPHLASCHSMRWAVVTILRPCGFGEHAERGRANEWEVHHVVVAP